MPMLFEQQDRESLKAFTAFKIYLDLGPQRSLVLVAEKVGKSRQMMEKWSRKFDWPARVQAYAAHLATLERHAIEGLALEKAVAWHKLHEGVRREAWQEAEQTIAMVRKAREAWLAKGRLPGWEGMARMLELAFKLKQFATGMPSEVKEVNTNITATIDVDWEVAIRKAYGLKGEVPSPGPVVEVVAVGEMQNAAGKMQNEMPGAPLSLNPIAGSEIGGKP